MSNGNLKIPYGVSDFKRLRREGFYFIDKSAYICMLKLYDDFMGTGTCCTAASWS